MLSGRVAEEHIYGEGDKLYINIQEQIMRIGTKWEVMLYSSFYLLCF